MSGRIIYRKKGLVVFSYEVWRAGKLIAMIAASGGRYYWYRLGPRADGEGPHNTLCIKDSAITVEGCQGEIEEFFKDR